MITCNKDGFIISNHATAQDILQLAQAIHTARSVTLPDGYRISSKIIDNMILAMSEATESYRKSIKQAEGA